MSSSKSRVQGGQNDKRILPSSSSSAAAPPPPPPLRVHQFFTKLRATSKFKAAWSKFHTEDSQIWRDLWTSQLPGVFCLVDYNFLYIQKNSYNNYAENIRRQPTKFSPLSNKVSKICAALIPQQQQQQQRRRRRRWRRHSQINHICMLRLAKSLSHTTPSSLTSRPWQKSKTRFPYLHHQTFPSGREPF